MIDSFDAPTQPNFRKPRGDETVHLGKFGTEQTFDQPASTNNEVERQREYENALLTLRGAMHEGRHSDSVALVREFIRTNFPDKPQPK